MKLRLATHNDLPELKIMFQKIIAEMYKNNIRIWNEFYPYEEFEGDIVSNSLYLLTSKEGIVAAFGMYNSVTGWENFGWEDKKANSIYLSRLGVNPNFLRKGIGSLILDYAQKMATKKNVSFIRLLVSNENIPAIKLYEKNGFVKVPGMYCEFSEASNKKIIEFGYEKKLVT